MDNFGPTTPAQKGKRITDILDECVAILSVSQSLADEILSFVHRRHQDTASAILSDVPLRDSEQPVPDIGTTVADGAPSDSPAAQVPHVDNVEPLEPSVTENATERFPDSVPVHVAEEPVDEPVQVSPFVVNGD